MDPAVAAQMHRLYFATSNDKKFVEQPLALAGRYGILPRAVSVAELTGA